MEGLKIRWMAREDIPCVESMSEKSEMRVPVLDMTKKSNIICVVSEANGIVNGFSSYKLGSSKITIKHLVVDEQFRRMGVATSIVLRLLSKMNEKRSVIETSVSEYNLVAHMFFKAMAFKAESIVDCDQESQYVFRRRLN